MTSPVRYRVSIVHPLSASDFGSARNLPKKVIFGIHQVGTDSKPYILEVSVASDTLDRCVELMRIQSTVVEADEDMALKKGNWKERVINATLRHILPDSNSVA